jgi:hypothetical protein
MKYIVYAINPDLSMSPINTFEDAELDEVDAYLEGAELEFYQVELYNAQQGSWTVVYQVLPPPAEPPPEEVPPEEPLEIDVTPN